MMVPRVQQNFRGSRAVIMAADGGGVDLLESFLTKLGLSVERVHLSDVNEVALERFSRDGDVFFIDADLDLSCLFHNGATAIQSHPVIGIVGVEAPGRLKALVNFGATAFLRKPIHVGAIYAALFLGVNNFTKRRALELQLEEHQQRRRRRRQVVKAIVLMMRELGIDDDEAYARLRRDSMRVRRSLEDHCDDYVAVRSMRTEGVAERLPCVTKRGSP